MSNAMVLFDFDGVLIDSLDEIALSAYNFATNSELTRLEDLPDGYLSLFRYNRHLLLGPSRLGKLAEWCVANLDGEGKSDRFLPREEFLRMLPGDLSELARIGDAFYATRERLMKNHPEAWLRIHRPFQAIWDGAKRTERFAILTYKNERAVRLLCDHFGMPSAEIFSGEGGRTKIENIRLIDSRHRAERYIFIDDAIENLIALETALPGRITPCFASWGYGSSEDRSAAADKGFEIFDEAGFVERYLSAQ